ncbi:hypothetical protein GDO86_016474 [Hymenochirus boettgeri]|uniref:G-protein coupled receptors family 1 profile domain-containing protein n=1 Tax=Hymenochirus boettgeri TaxID=247094 RepID=A0A8T2K373_9PIPI|nr:hypothetical protein GDO86_016474 [Hymenochirus boettgeri]
MEQRNQTLVQEFILLAMTSVPYYQTILFIIFLMLYLFTLIGNVSILTVVIMDRRLHIPMYFFLDLFHSLFGCTMPTSTSMAYDRYMAICNPLRYNIVMGKSSCILLIFSSWSLSSFHSLTQTILTSQLPFCYLNQISHFSPEHLHVERFFSSYLHLEILFTIATGFITVSTSSLIFLSYFFICKHLLILRSFKERRKAFSTCTSHLTVVFLIYGPIISRFIRPATNDSMEQDRQTAILYTIITPALNPLIYTLRNKEVKSCFFFFIHLDQL